MLSSVAAWAAFGRHQEYLHFPLQAVLLVEQKAGDLRSPAVSATPRTGFAGDPALGWIVWIR
jgi:hypothetical protein